MLKILQTKILAWKKDLKTEAQKILRLYHLYLRAAENGWKVVDRGHWEFYMIQAKHPHVRWPPAGTCEMQELEEALHGKK